MAGKGTIGGKIVLEGESQYTNALKNIRAQQSELRSEMKLCQTTFKDNQNSLEALSKKHEILTKQIDVNNEKINIYSKITEESTKKQEAYAVKIGSLQSELGDAEKKLKDMSESSGSASDAMEKQGKVVSELKEKLSLAQQGYEKTSREITQYQVATNYAEAENKTLQRELDATSKYLDEAEKSTDKCATSIDEYGKETDEATKQTSIFGDVLKAELLSEAIKTGIKELANGIKAIASAATESGSSFEASMSQVAATMGMTAEEVNNGSEAYTLLSDAAKECGKSTMFSASQAGEALNYLALAGYDAEKAAATLPKTLDLAAAGGLDLAYASDLVTDSMAALGMETDQLDKYIDEMARTSQKSNTSVAQLGEATLVCAGTVSLAGQSLETMNTELGVLANNGIKGAEGGTHLRNVILSLSAPTDTAAAALDQLGIRVSNSEGNMRDLNDILTDLNSSMSTMSSTEKTRMISRIFNKTDIASVNALLKGTGEEYDNLYAEIKNCDGAATAMAETMNDNLKGKVTILQSALEGLGISAYEIFDEDMKEAVEAATDAVGTLQRSIDNGDLGVSMNKMSQAMGDFAENAINVGEDAIPVVIDGMTWLLENADLVASGIAGIVTANVAMNVAAPAVNAAKKAWEGYQLVTQGAATWQEVLNISMSANPAGILITAVTALTAAVGAYILMNKDGLIAVDETTKATRKLVETSKELNDTYATSAADRSTAKESLEAEAASCKNLVSELKDLQSKTELTASEQARQRMIVDELNQAVPDLNLAIDEQTGELNKSTDALEENVEAMMAMARAAAAREDLIRIAEEQYEAEKSLAELEKQREEQIKIVEEAQKSLNGVVGESTGKTYEQIEAYSAAGAAESQALYQAKEALEELDATINETKESETQLKTEYEETLQYISDTEALAGAAEATDELGDAATATGTKISEMSEAAQAAFSKMYDEVSETVSEQMDLFSEFDGRAELSAQKLLENMQSQIDGVENWSENLKELADRGINQGLLQYLADMGPNGAGYVATFAEMTDEELKKANDMWTASLMLSDTAAQSIAEAYTTAGEMATQGFSEGITASQMLATKAVEILSDEVVKCLETKLDINSPSRVTREIGQYAGEGLELGIKDRTQNIVSQMELTAMEVIGKAQKVLNKKDFQTIGETTDEGMRTGIQSKQAVLVSQMSATSNSVLDKAKGILTIQEFKTIGERSQGIQTGILNKQSSVVSQMSATSGKVLSAAQDGLKKSSFVDIGENIISGLTSAISNGTSRVVNGIKDLCTSAVKAAKEKLDIHSPSKVFYEIGDYTGQGFILGWQDRMANIEGVIADSMPEVSMAEKHTGSRKISGYGVPVMESDPEVVKKIDVMQNINIYAKTDSLSETSWKFRQAQREAAVDW